VRLDLNAVLAGIVARFEQQVAGTGVEVTCVLPEGPVDIQGDEIMLQEAFLNLLTNAVVHGGSGLTVIALELVVDRERIEIQIADNGVGILPVDRMQAISRFGQTDGGPGSGLGLPIAVRVMENHGGTLRIAGNSFGGTTILLSLPRDDG
jgi:two-component system sensor histidine kinase TctE